MLSPLSQYATKWERNAILQNLFAFILPKVLIYCIQSYDLAFSLVSHKVGDFRPLVFYEKEVWMINQERNKLIHPFSNRYLVLKKEEQNISHDGWQPLEDSCGYRKRSRFDVYGDSYKEEKNHWNINGHVVLRPIGREPVVFKRNNKIYTFSQDNFFKAVLNRKQNSTTPWRHFILNKFLLRWDQCSIFLDDILMFVDVVASNDSTPENPSYLGKLILYLFDVAQIQNFMEPFLAIEIGQTYTLATCYALATKNVIHIVARMKNETTYFELHFNF